ncbi:MAG: hypothetical protein E7031_00735 [Akkermansiaceae bacterium]|nr:hypothetical protein [Akkermansiaceae bacterium]
MKHQPEQDQVTTEPQRQALEAMSEELVRKLNLMVAEQNARAQEFANQQHSLSALPVQQPQQVKTPNFVQHQPKVESCISNYQKRQPAQPIQPPVTPPQMDFWQEPVPHKSQHKPNRPSQRKQPTIIQQNKEEEGVSATTVIVILLIAFSILSRACS